MSSSSAFVGREGRLNSSGSAVRSRFPRPIITHVTVGMCKRDEFERCRPM